MKSIFQNSKQPEKRLTRILKKHSGRDSFGHVSVRHQGGRQKRFYRDIDFKRNKRNVAGVVQSIEYDPNRNANIALILYPDNEKKYIIHPKELKIGDAVVAGESVDITIGNALPLKNIPIGIQIHNLELHPNQGGKIIRGAGSTAVVVAKEGAYVHIKLPSGETRKFHENCYATIGMVGNLEHKDRILRKAGTSRLMGIRPTVRGTAQNPRSHPHGGGEGRVGEGMHPKTPWGKSARGTRTRKRNKSSSKLIIVSRHK